MSKVQEKQALTSTSSPIKEHADEGRDDYEEFEQEAVSGSGCGCFRLFCFEAQPIHGGERWCLLQSKGDHIATWVTKELKNLKEASEVVAGPKWKNFIRKFGKYFSKKKSNDRFQYDPQSYALNFDDGRRDEDEEEDGLLLRFSGPTL